MSGIIGGAGSKSGVIGTTELEYEEGTWLPNLTDNASPVPNALGHSTQAGFYTKIGNTVHISGQFTCNSLSGVTTSSDIYLRGLPFTIKDATGAYANCVNGYCASMALGRADQSVVWNLQKGQTYGYGMIWDRTGGMGFMTVAQFSDGGSVSFTGHYFV